MDITIAVTRLSALAQETRLKIFRHLVQVGPEGVTPGELAKSLGLVQATLSFHLKELRQAGLIHARQESRYIYYSANFECMNALLGFLTENCCQGDRAACDLELPGC